MTIYNHTRQLYSNNLRADLLHSQEILEAECQFVITQDNCIIKIRIQIVYTHKKFLSGQLIIDLNHLKQVVSFYVSPHCISLQ